MIWSRGEILLVDDNPGDVRLTREALGGGTVAVNLSVVGDGTEALAFLRRQGRHAEAPRPDLVLLDLNLPGMPGLELLAEIKADGGLRRIPVVVLSSSAAPDDVRRAYELQASCYVTKPGDLDQFLRVVRSVQHFCLTVAKPPPRD
jgi:CheY-like chemotaxis protein